MAVAITITPVVTGYRWTRCRARYLRSSPAATSAVHIAQARCRDGIAAYWSAGTGPPCVVPYPASATESAYPSPGSSRGGITGTKKNTVMPTTLVITRALRTVR